MSKYISILLIIHISTFCSLIHATSFSTCPLQSTLFLYDLRSQSPISFLPTPPLQVGGDFLETALNSKDVNTYTSVLFYASWCPFSNDVLPTFEVLSSMFPQITHVAVEESSVLPSILSRYGIHSFPIILIVKQASKVRLHGRKDLHSILRFYRKTTGLDPMHYVAVDEPASLKCSGEFVMQSWVGSSPTEILRKEPYLVLSLLFLCLVGFTYTFPRVVSHFKALWVSYGPHLNLEIFGETSQILGRVLQMINVKRIWTKLKLCKTGSFISGAKNARVWASSLASVSLGNMEDLEEWEFISHDAFLGDEDTAIFLGEHDKDSSITTVFMMNHFAHSSHKSRNAAEYSVMPNQKHNHEAPDEVMKENILHKSSLINTGIEPEDTKQQDTNIKEDDRESNVLEGTKGAKVLCKKSTLGGLLAICSFAAAAIICIVFLGKRWPHDQKLRLQIYTGDGEVCK